VTGVRWLPAEDVDPRSGCEDWRRAGSAWGRSSHCSWTFGDGDGGHGACRSRHPAWFRCPANPTLPQPHVQRPTMTNRSFRASVNENKSMHIEIVLNLHTYAMADKFDFTYIRLNPRMSSGHGIEGPGVIGNPWVHPSYSAVHFPNETRWALVSAWRWITRPINEHWTSFRKVSILCIKWQSKGETLFFPMQHKGENPNAIWDWESRSLMYSNHSNSGSLIIIMMVRHDSFIRVLITILNLPQLLPFPVSNSNCFNSIEIMYPQSTLH